MIPINMIIIGIIIRNLLVMSSFPWLAPVVEEFSYITTPSAFFSLALYILSPNILAHSRLITTDLYATASITIAV